MESLKIEFEHLVETHKATIYTVCYMYASNRQEADDLFQETLINLWRGFKSFQGKGSLKSWVYRVALNTCLSYKRKKRIKTEPLDISSDIFISEKSVGDHTDTLHDRIIQLDPLERAIVLLWLEDMSYDEIGAIVGMLPKTVGVRLIRIKEKLKKMNSHEQ